MSLNKLPMCILQCIADKYLEFCDIMNLIKINKNVIESKLKIIGIFQKKNKR